MHWVKAFSKAMNFCSVSVCHSGCSPDRPRHGLEKMGPRKFSAKTLDQCGEEPPPSHSSWLHEVALRREVNTQELKKIIKNDCSAMTVTGDVFRKHCLQGKELWVDKIRAPLLSRGIFNILASTNMFSMIQKSTLTTDRLSQRFSAIKAKQCVNSICCFSLVRFCWQIRGRLSFH